jgi:hypothetical protein
MLLLRLLRWSLMWFRFEFSFPFQLRLWCREEWWKELWEPQQPPPHVGT